MNGHKHRNENENMDSYPVILQVRKIHVRLGFVLSHCTLRSIGTLDYGRGEGTWISKQYPMRRVEGMENV